MLNYIIRKYGADLTNAPATAQGNYEGEVVYSTAAPKIDFDYSKPSTKADYRPIKIVEDTINAPSEQRITGDEDIRDVFDSLTAGNGR